MRHDRPRLHGQGQRPGADRGHDRHAGSRAEASSPPSASGRWAARRRSPTPASTGSRSPGAPSAAPYSIDDNLWGRSSEGRTIEDLDTPPPDDVFQLVTRPEEAPDEPESVRIGFEAGEPVSRRRRGARRSSSCSTAWRRSAASHGVGIVDHLEDRIVGLKVRDLYEVPAAAIVLPRTRTSRSSSRPSTRTTSSRRSRRTGPISPTRASGTSRCVSDLDAFMLSANAHVTGEVTVKLYKGIGDPGRPQLSLRALRQVAGQLRRVRRRVQPAGEPGLHRAVLAAEPARAPGPSRRRRRRFLSRRRLERDGGG